MNNWKKLIESGGVKKGELVVFGSGTTDRALDNLVKVYVYPTGDNHEEPPTWMSDDYEVRYTKRCEVCDEDYHIHYKEPFASCSCGTTDWYV